MRDDPKGGENSPSVDGSNEAIWKALRRIEAQSSLTLKKQIQQEQLAKEKKVPDLQSFEMLPFASSNTAGRMEDPRLRSLQEILDFEKLLKGSKAARQQFVSRCIVYTRCQCCFLNNIRDVNAPVKFSSEYKARMENEKIF